jgi:hypothetical protein
VSNHLFSVMHQTLQQLEVAVAVRGVLHRGADCCMLLVLLPCHIVVHCR